VREKDPRLVVTAEDLATDVHWQKGIRCHDCHGGDPDVLESEPAHAAEAGFRKDVSPLQIPDLCGRCHSDASYMERFRPDARTDHTTRFWSSAHGRHLQESSAEGAEGAATCTSCHPRHSIRSAVDTESETHIWNLSENCGSCHRDQLIELRKGVHNKAGEKNDAGVGTALDCVTCHGGDAHALIPVADHNSPVFLDHQVELCGSCHEKHLETYQRSVHGHGLVESGLLLTAVCADCHGAHGIYRAPDRRSTLHTSNVAATCGECHLLIDEKLQRSVHGSEAAPGMVGEHAAPGGTSKRTPSCTDCHQDHDLPHPDFLRFREQIPDRCGNCHPDLSHRYRLSMHGELTALGYEPAAKCSDCHGSHDILPTDSPLSPLSPENRVETCRRCHFNAVPNFTQFDPHASHKDEERYPRLHAIYVWLDFIIYSAFGVFVLFAGGWFVRSFVQTLKYGRHRRLATRERAVVKSAPVNRRFYFVLLISFLVLVLTGVPLKYSFEPWAQQLADALGGFENTSQFHHFFAAIILVFCAGHVIGRLARITRYAREKRPWKQILWGPDSSLPNRRDLRDSWNMIGWFLGRRPKPKFERWTFWEKLDYWALYLLVAVIGTTGLMLWFPNLFCRVLSGESLNVAKVIHAQVAMPAACLLFIIHLFNTHLRPEKFPMDLSVFTGLVSEEHLQEARPEYLERLRREGKLEALRTVVPSHRRLRLFIWSGSIVLLVGLVLLFLIWFAILGK
jgi:cytochrome b subunit of formate dehydrogenase